MSAVDYQVGGRHYQDLAIQPVEYCLANMLPFCEGNVVKYVTRWRRKGGIEDLRKARHFVELVRESPDYRYRLSVERWRSYEGAGWRESITPEDYIRANGLPTPEGRVVTCVTNFANTGHQEHLGEAAKWLDELIALEAGVDFHPV